MISVFSEWLTETANSFIDVINRGECASAINYSSRGQVYRVPQLIDALQSNVQRFSDKNLPHIETLDLHSFLTSSMAEFVSLLHEFAGQRGKKNLVIFLMNADLLLSDRTDLLPVLNTFSSSQDHCSIIYFFKKNITAPFYVKKISHFSTLYHNILVKKPYKSAEVRVFIQDLEKEYNIPLDKALREYIITQCGDRLWLVRESLRHLSKTGDRTTLFNHDGMILRLNTILSEMEEWEHAVIRKLVRNETTFSPDEKQTMTYLHSAGFLSKEGQGYIITVPLIREYAKTFFSAETSISVNKQNDIVVNNTVVTSVFSPSERRLVRYLILHKGEVISRDVISQEIWKEKSAEKYSDWAIDQLVRRVRQKFVKLGLPENTVVTKKNQGYLIAS